MTPYRFRFPRGVKGWRKPPGGVVCAYTSRWANPHKPTVHTPEAHSEAVARYRVTLAGRPDLIAQLDTLRGRPLGCTCRLDLPCHVDVLLLLANE